ncbi:MAG TPA: HAD-IA family hydrolase [Anaerolineaceae bacterium]|nr:HAD-IA family hydrolase [Anaerolineaceae bacterium]
MPEFCADAILFDMDGVLVDSWESIRRHWRTWAERHQLDMEAVMDQVHGKAGIDIIRAIAPHLDAEAETRFLADLEAADTGGVRRIPGADRLLAGLPADRWAVVTSARENVARSRLRAAGLPEPAVLVTASEIERGKPDPQGYWIAAGRLGFAPAACLVVEDSPAGVEAARRAGIRVIAVLTTHVRSELPAADAFAGRLEEIRVGVAEDGRLSVEVGAAPAVA